jgi:hypothetical protein
MAMRLPTRTRCARCEGEWVAQPEPEAVFDSEPEAVLDSEPEAMLESVPGAAPDVMLAAVPEVPATGPTIDPVAEPETRSAPEMPANSAISDTPRSRPGGYGAAGSPGQPTGSTVGWWVGSVVLVVVLIALFLGFHRAIGAAWPPSVRLYRALGL